MNSPLLILGAGGHARVIESLLQHDARFTCVGVLDATTKHLGEKIGHAKIVGEIAALARYAEQGVRHVALAYGENRKRRELFEHAATLGFEVVSLRHPTSFAEAGVTMGKGITCCAGVMLAAQVTLEDDVLVNTGAIIDHESVVKKHSHVAPGCRIAGRVVVGEGALVGIGSTIKEKVTIGAWSVIGAGSVVVTDIPDGVVAWGCPARVQRRLDDSMDPEAPHHASR